MVLQKQISLLLDCYLLSQNVSTYILYENHPTFKNNFMSFQPVFVQFWEKVKESIQDGTYAKLTLAKP
jgi:hypothetical protein